MVSLVEKYFPSVGKKVALAVAGVLTAFGAAFVIMAQLTGSALIVEDARGRAIDVADLMRVMVEHAMMEGQPRHARHALSNAAASDLVRNAYFLTDSGSVIGAARASASETEIDIHRFEDLPDLPDYKHLLSLERDTLFEYLAAPVVKKRECYACHPSPSPTQGYFVMKLALDDFRAAAAEHRLTNLLMATLTFFGVGAVLYFVISMIVIRPLKELHRHFGAVRSAMEHMERGDRKLFPVVEVPQGTDEIAELRRDFNLLVERLNAAYTSLSEMHAAQLEQADRLATTGQMAASMAHEIKNPLAGVLGALQVFESEMKENDERQEIFAEMKLQLERMNHAVNDLLAYARPTPPHFEEVNLRPMIEKTLALLRCQTDSQGITIRTLFPGDNVVLDADGKQLQQVLWNIMLNGLQAMNQEGTLTVATRAQNEQVEIVVRDTGKGIPPEQIGKIFHPFFTTRHRGTGLGMTISRGIVEHHRGSIDVASDVGKGTTVRIVLPTHQKPAGD